MKMHGKNAIYNNEERHTKKSDLLLRAICMVLCAVFVLLACVGCTSYASVDEVGVLNAELDEAINALNSLKESYQAAQQEIETLKSDGENMQKTLNALKYSYESAQKEIVSLKDDKATMQQQIDALKKKNDATLQEIEALKSQIQDLENRGKIKIYIDQGHNPTSEHNSGASGNGLYEEDLTFSIGILLAELLEEDERFAVCLSRPTADTVLGTDNDSSLDARILGAKNFKADYFISLHVNSYEDSSVNGIEVYTAEESGVSYDFGNAILQGLLESTNLYDRGMKQGPDLRVLKNATMPAALLEMGFISNSDDAALLSESPELFAQGIYNGILNYFGLTVSESTMK